MEINRIQRLKSAKHIYYTTGSAATTPPRLTPKQRKSSTRGDKKETTTKSKVKMMKRIKSGSPLPEAETKLITESNFTST